MTASRILVVDDETDIRGLLKEILSEEGQEEEQEKSQIPRQMRARGRRCRHPVPLSRKPRYTLGLP